MTIRWATNSDYDVLGQIMFDAVRNGPSEYSETQRRAWVPAPCIGEEWNARLAQQEIALVEAEGVVQGFMSLAPNGYIDFAYVRPPFQRTGLFRRLFEAIQGKAMEAGVSRLWTHASLMARPAFSAMSFKIVCCETVRLGDEVLERYEMEKLLIE